MPIAAVATELPAGLRLAAPRATEIFSRHRSPTRRCQESSWARRFQCPMAWKLMPGVLSRKDALDRLEAFASEFGPLLR